MKKRFLTLILTLTAMLTCVFGLTACNKVEFKVNFVVDGEVYSTINTNGEEIIKIPENPIKEGYTFDGWFWDKDTWQTPFTANSLLDAPLSSDMNVYCKWKANVVSVESISLNKTEITLHKDDVEYLTATILPANATDSTVVWESSNSTIATVVGGKVTALRVGNVTITATTKDGGKLATCNVYVEPILVESVSLNYTSLSLLNGENKTLTATVMPYNATEKSVLWQSSNSSVVSVDNGVIKAVGYGNVIITVTTIDGNKMATCEVEVVKDEIAFNTLTVDGESIYGKVSNNTTTFSFIKEIQEHGNATYKVFKEITCETEIYSKSISLKVGDNTVYVLQSVGKDIKLYTVTVRRRPTYKVTFNSNGGSIVESQTVEEDFFATAPTTSKTGYTFGGWDYDFTTPITKNETVTALWMVNDNTPYTVEYYLENLENEEYTLTQTNNLTGVTDTTAYAEIKTFEHFTAEKQTVSGNIDGNGTTVLKVYYQRNEYTVSNADNSLGSITGAGKYKYGKQVTLTATPDLGYDFIGWYNGNTLLNSNLEYKFTIDKDIIAKFTIKPEMANFNFTSTATTCVISGVKNKTITEITVPNYVTSIGSSAFAYCKSLTSITLPFVGASKTASSGYDQVFGYIFGYTTTESSSSVSGATYQYYNSNTSSSYKYYHYYIPTSLKSVTVTGGSIPYEAFYNCWRLTSVAIGNNVQSIGSSAFRGCSSLTSIEIPNSVTSIGNYAFAGCDSLTSVVIGDSVTSIGYYAFWGCSSLESIEIPNSVQSIGCYAFYECSSLTSITFNDTSTWYRTKDRTNWGNKTGGTQTSVTNASTNATYFKSDYYYYWYKK